MDFGVIGFFLLFAFFTSMGCRRWAIIMIEDFGTNSRCYPKGYVEPAKWARKLFSIRQRVIPKYYYFELILSIFHALLGPINLVICAVTDCSIDVIRILIWFLIVINACDIILSMVMLFILKRKR